jgi:hypothetical protein
MLIVGCAGGRILRRWQVTYKRTGALFCTVPVSKRVAGGHSGLESIKGWGTRSSC